MPRSTTPTTKTAAVKASAKKAAGAKKAVASKDAQPRAGSTLRAHPTKEGVWLNSMDVECDHRGISLAFLGAAADMVAATKVREIEVLGREATDPLDVLRYGAMDRALPYPVRMEAAGKAVAYTNRKMPMAVDGGPNPNDPNGPGLPINITDLKGLTGAEITALKALLLKAQGAAEK